MSKRGSDSLDVAIRSLLAFAGAVGLVSLFKDLMTWQQDLALWLDAFRAVTRPIVSFLFGWTLAIFGMELPGFAKDYLTVGVITVGAASRTIVYMGDFDRIMKEDIASIIIASLLFIVAWPYLVYLVISGYREGNRKNIIGAKVFASTYIYAIVIVAINYAIIFGGAATGG